MSACTTATPWKLEADQARLQQSRLNGGIDLRTVQRGLIDLTIDQRHIAGQLLGVVLGNHAGSPPTRRDAYVRGNDLIAVYERTQPYRLTWQLAWRILPGAVLDPRTTVIDLQLGVQTDLLDSLPQTTTCTQLPAAEVLHIVDPARQQTQPLDLAASPPIMLRRAAGSGCLLLRPANADFSYAEMVHPAEFDHSSIARCADPPGAVRLVHSLFTAPLEKGVILRGRLRGAFVPRGDDVALAAAAYLHLAQSPPPLTA